MPFSNLRAEWENPFLGGIFEQLARQLTVIHYDGRGWNAMSATQTQALLSLIEQDWDLFADTAAHRWLGWSAGQAGLATAEGIRGAVTPQIARATLQAASAIDVTDQLARVAAPTLVLHRRDMARPGPWYRRLSDSGAGLTCGSTTLAVIHCTSSTP